MSQPQKFVATSLSAGAGMHILPAKCVCVYIYILFIIIKENKLITIEKITVVDNKYVEGYMVQWRDS